VVLRTSTARTYWPRGYLTAGGSRSATPEMKKPRSWQGVGLFFVPGVGSVVAGKLCRASAARPFSYPIGVIGSCC